MANQGLGAKLKTLLDEGNPKGTIRLHLEPVLKGYPFPKAAGGPAPEAGAEPVRYQGALYVYDDALLKPLAEQGLIRSLKSGLVEGVDWDGKPCKKVYVQMPVLEQYFQLQAGARKAFEDNAGVEMLGLNPSSEVAMAVARMQPSGDLSSEHNHALILRVLDRTPPAIGYQLLRESGLMKGSDGHTRVPHYIEYSQAEGIYTLVVPITQAVAQSILRCESNHCRNWIDAAVAQKMGLNGHETMEMLAETAVSVPEMKQVYSSRLSPQARAAAAAKAGGQSAVAADVEDAVESSADAAAEQLPPLSSFREELKGLLRSDAIRRTTQPLVNGGVRQVLRITGEENQRLIRRLSTENQKRLVSDPLAIGFFQQQQQDDANYYYFSASEQELAKLTKALGVSHIPTCDPLPVQIPKDPFRRAFSGDQGRPMGISNVFLHQQGNEHVMYVASDSAVRLKLLADQFGIRKDSPNRSWITNEDESPSIMRLVVPAEAFTALAKEKIRSAEARRSGGSTPQEKLPERLDATLSRADAEAKIRGQFAIKDRSKPAPADKSDREPKAPKIGPEAGIPKLKELLREELARETKKEEGKPASNMPTTMYRACLAKVRRKDRDSGEYVTASELYIRGTNNDLRALVGRLRKAGWPDNAQIRFEVGKGLEGALPGLVSVTLPDTLPNDAWSQIQREFADTVETVSPEKLSVAGSEADAQAFQNSGQMKRELTRYFDSFQRFGKYVSPEELVFSNLKGKAIRVVTITKPDESKLRLIDEQIGKIQAALGVLKETAERLHDQAALMAFESGGKGKTARKRKDIPAMDGVGAIVKGAAESATRAGHSQETAVRRLQAEVGTLRSRRQAIEHQGQRQEIVILDPDHDTERLLREAKEIVTGPIHHDGKALRFAPAPDLMETLRSRNMRPDRLRADAVPEGEVGAAVERALERHRKKKADAEERVEGTAPVPQSQRTVKAHAVRPVREIASALRPILVYEQASDQSAPRPILILPLRDHHEGDQAAKLCKKLSQMDWLEQTQWHWLQDTLEERRAAQPQSAAARKPHRLAVPVGAETAFESRVKGTLRDLIFHAGRLRAETPDAFHQSAFQEHLRDLLSLLRDGEQARGGTVEEMGQREVVALFNDQGLRGKLDRLLAAGNDAVVTSDMASQLYGDLRQVERAIASRQHHATDSATPDASDTVTVIGRKQPYPLDAEITPDHDPFVYSDALGQMARDMAGAGNKTPALKVYLSDMGATAFKEWAKECGVDVVTDRQYAPSELVDFASRKLGETGHRKQSSSGRQAG